MAVTPDRAATGTLSSSTSSPHAMTRPSFNAIETELPAAMAVTPDWASTGTGTS